MGEGAEYAGELGRDGLLYVHSAWKDLLLVQR